MRAALFAVPLVLAACASSPEGSPSADASPPPPPPPPAPTQPWSTKPSVHTLHLVHVSDTEAGMLGDDLGVGGVARGAAVIEALRARGPSLVVHGGDTFIPAPEVSLELRWPSDGAQRAPALLLANNALGVNVAAVGNHDFDLGESFLADAIARATFPYMASTLSVSGGALQPKLSAETPWLGTPAALGKLLRRARACVGTLVGDRCTGFVVGVVSAVPETLRVLSTGARTTSAPATAAETIAALTPHLAELQRLGAGTIVLLSNRQGVRNDLALVEAGLVGVDVIVSGGGENRLANHGHRLNAGDVVDPLCAEEPLGCYPLWRTAKDGAAVAIVSTDGGLRTVGALDLGVDADGHITGAESPSRPWPIDEVSLLELRANPDRALLALELLTRDALAPLSEVVGHVDVYLDGTREVVRNGESNLGSLSADALLAAARKEHPNVIAAFRNAGAIRASIGVVDKTGARRGKDVTVLDVKSALRFDNPVVIVDVTHRVLARAIEASLAGAGTGQGCFPHVSAGVRLRYSESGADLVPQMDNGRVVGVARDGSRLKDLILATDTGVVVVAKDGFIVDPDAVVRVATIDYLRNGGDGWFPDGAPIAQPSSWTEQRAFTALVGDAKAVKASLAVAGRIVAVP